MQPEKLFSLLSDSTRLRILGLLEASPTGLAVSDIAKALRLKVPSASQHLRQLADAGLLESSKRGRSVAYSLPSRSRKELRDALGHVPGARTRPARRLSARNTLLGTVTAIERDQVTSSVTLDVSGQKVQSVITTEALEDLGLEIGDAAYAVVKATEVMLMR